MHSGAAAERPAPSTHNDIAIQQGQPFQAAPQRDPCPAAQGDDGLTEANLGPLACKDGTAATSIRDLPPLTSEPVNRVGQQGNDMARGLGSVKYSPETSKPCLAKSTYCSPPSTSNPEDLMEGKRQSVSRHPLHEGPSSADKKVQLDSRGETQSARSAASQKTAASRPQLEGKQHAVATRLLDRHAGKARGGHSGLATAERSQAAIRESNASGSYRQHNSEQAQLTGPTSNKRKSPDLYPPSPVSGYEKDANLEAGRKLPRQDSKPGLPGVMQRPYLKQTSHWKHKTREEDFLPECDLSPCGASKDGATATRRLPNQVSHLIQKLNCNSVDAEKNAVPAVKVILNPDIGE